MISTTLNEMIFYRSDLSNQEYKGDQSTNVKEILEAERFSGV